MWADRSGTQTASTLRTIAERRAIHIQERNGAMSVDENKRSVERTFARLFNHGELALADELVSADFLNHDAPPDAPRGPVGFRHMVTLLRTAFPDIHYETEEIIGEGDKVVARTRMTGTQTGPLFGIPPTGKRVEQEQIHIVRFEAGKAVEHRAVRDDLAMMRQLGLVPADGRSNP
jgi:predicted ester cyclase